MRDRLFSLLGIEPGEESLVSVLLMQSIFLGIFFGAFDISAHSLFLSVFDEKMMARGYVVSGIAGIILTSLYTMLQTRMQFRNFAIINLITVTSLTLILWVSLVLNPANWIVFIVFIMLGPLNILAMLGFWGTAGRLFSLRQGKRLFGLVDSGLIIGIIISCYTIPVLLSFKMGSHNIILISAISIFIATVFQVLMRKRFHPIEVKQQQKTETEEEKKSVFSVFRDDPYTRTMAIFIILSVVTAFFVQYSFMAVTREQYPSAEDMARFLGIFTGSMMIFTLLVKLLVFSYLIRNYGLRICLAVSPMLIAVFTAVAIMVGMLMGYTLEAQSGFIIFFLLLALSRLFSKALKDSIESPSFKVIYQTINERIRFKIQSGMDGTVNEIAALSSGLLLAGLGALSFVKLIHFSWVLFIIITMWLFVSFRLYREYRRSIRKALEPANTVKQEQASPEKAVFKNRFSAESDFRSNYFRLVSGDYSVLENNHSHWYYRKIVDFSEKKSDINLIPVLKKIELNKNIDEEIRRISSSLIRDLEKIGSNARKEDNKLIAARKNLLGNRLPQTTEILRLLRDNSLESKRLGIFMIGKFKLSDMLAEVFECLNIPGLERDALAVLSNFEKEAGNELQRFYLVASGNAGTGNTILRLLGKSGAKENLGFLFARLWSNSRQVKELVLECLIENKFRPSPEEKDRLHQLISDVIGIMVWNLSAKICLQRNKDDTISAIIEKESKRWNDFLFNLLSVTYDPGSISKIRENLTSETVESVNFALEMIDIVIDETIKPKLIALLDAVPDEEKIKNLFHFYPGEIPGYDRLLDDILNRDYNLISIWTKAFTLRNMKEPEEDEIIESVIALLFSPEAILKEESAQLISKIGMELYRSVSERLPLKERKRLEKIVDRNGHRGDLIYEKTEFLSQCFSNLREEELLSLAEQLSYTADYRQAQGFTSEGCIIWSLKNDKPSPEPYLSYSDKTGLPGDFSGSDPLYLLTFKAIEEHQYQFPENSLEILNYIDKYEG